MPGPVCSACLGNALTRTEHGAVACPDCGRAGTAAQARYGHLCTAGLAVVQAAKGGGSWDALNAVEQLAEPSDLAQALDDDPAARVQWEAFPRSTKRAILEWITTAKAPETRRRRIDETVSEARVGRRANQWRQPKGR